MSRAIAIGAAACAAFQLLAGDIVDSAVFGALAAQSWRVSSGGGDEG